MNICWTFENGKLVSRNGMGEILFSWQTDESMGGAMADLFNYSQTLSRILLFWLVKEEKSNSEEII